MKQAGEPVYPFVLRLAEPSNRHPKAVCRPIYLN